MQQYKKYIQKNLDDWKDHLIFDEYNVHTSKIIFYLLLDMIAIDAYYAGRTDSYNDVYKTSKDQDG